MPLLDVLHGCAVNVEAQRGDKCAAFDLSAGATLCGLLQFMVIGLPLIAGKTQSLKVLNYSFTAL